MRVALDTPDVELEQMALTNERVAEFLAGKEVRKAVIIRNKLVNIVAS